jgi:hypothetical protein
MDEGTSPKPDVVSPTDAAHPMDSAGGGEAGMAAACPADLKDKMTTCTSGTTPSCVKGCGPNLPAGATQPNLGTKTCSCATSDVYECADCVYESPLPACFTPSATPPACAAGVANEGACATPCSGSGTGNDVCTLLVDGGKTDGCVCVQGATSPAWTCATQWW